MPQEEALNSIIAHEDRRIYLSQSAQRTQRGDLMGRRCWQRRSSQRSLRSLARDSLSPAVYYPSLAPSEALLKPNAPFPPLWSGMSIQPRQSAPTHPIASESDLRLHFSHYSARLLSPGPLFNNPVADFFTYLPALPSTFETTGEYQRNA